MDTLERMALTVDEREVLINLVEDCCYIFFNQHACMRSVEESIRQARRWARDRLPKPTRKLCSYQIRTYSATYCGKKA